MDELAAKSPADPAQSADDAATLFQLAPPVLFFFSLSRIRSLGPWLLASWMRLMLAFAIQSVLFAGPLRVRRCVGFCIKMSPG